jgi:hypothetical protein
MATIWASRFFPSLVDRYLGRSGYDAQQTDVREDPDRPDNLERPVEGDRGAHGEFDSIAASRSPYLRVTTHRRPILTAAALAAGAVLLARRRRAS